MFHKPKHRTSINGSNLRPATKPTTTQTQCKRSITTTKKRGSPISTHHISTHSPQQHLITNRSKRSFLGGFLNVFKPAATSAFEMPPINVTNSPAVRHPALHHNPSTYNSHNEASIHAKYNQHNDKDHQHVDECKHPPRPHAPDTNRHHHQHSQLEKSPGQSPNPDHDQHQYPQRPTQSSSSPSPSPSPSSSSSSSQPRYRKMTPNEQDMSMLLCDIKHPETGTDIIQGEFVTQVKETSPGAILIKIKLDKNFRHLKSEIEAAVASRYHIESTMGANTNTSNKQPLKSLKVSLADTQDDPQSLDPVKQPPIATAIAFGGKKPVSGTMLKTTSVGTSTGVGSQQQQPKQQQSLTTANQTVGSGARGLSGVKKVILVYSGKGGVGKSSVAVNLAAAMSQLPSSSSSPTTTSTSSTNNKLNIGLFDADIFGPSLPSLIDVMSLSQGIIGSDGIDPTPPATSQSIDLVEDYVDDTSAMIRPIKANNMKLMSYGYVTRTKGGHGTGNAGPAPAIMRGGMVGPYLTELLTRTNWGDLDALIIDMPPGTSDVHITITQQVKNASAVIVTTPSKLAFVDVVRGMQLLDQTNIPIVSLVQNMSYFVAPNDPTQTKHYIFGGGPDDMNHKPQLQPQSSQSTPYHPPSYQSKLLTLGSIPTYTEMPIISTIANDAEEGLPLVMKHAAVMQRIIDTIPDDAAQITVKDHRSGVPKSTLKQTKRAFDPATLADIDPILASLSPPSPTTLSSSTTIQNTGLASTLYNFALLAKQVHHWSTPIHRSSISRPDMNLDFDQKTNVMRVRSGDALHHQITGGQGVFDPDTPEPVDFQLDPRLIRQKCVCAACIHEFTGTPLSDPNKIPLDVHPTAIQARGAYAVAVQWSDGHSGSIYTWDMLMGLNPKQNPHQM